MNLKKSMKNFLVLNMNMNLNKIKLLILLTMILLAGCKNPSSPEIAETNNNYDLCYVKLINDNWEVVLNNKGSIKNLSNNPMEDNSPAISPNRKYIAFSHLNFEGSDIYLYDIYRDSVFNITHYLDTLAGYSPQWVNNNKIVYAYHRIGENEKTYVIDINTNEKKEILNFSANLFFCKNENDFFYIADYTIYKTNIDGTYNEPVLNLKEIGEEYTTVFDFEPLREKLLLLIAQTPRTTNIIAEYDVNTRKIDTISVAEPGYLYFTPTYSNDYSKIAALSKTYDYHTSKIILFEGKNKRELITLQNNKSWFYLYKYAFSSDDQKVIYAVETLMEGNDTPYWYSDLYVYNLSTGQNTYIDKGVNPVWLNK
jgi:Tol biopolymer transport system component